MAYRLRQDERIPDGLRRLARKELGSAIDVLQRSASPRDEAVHDARKSLKKVRAILQLINDDDGHGIKRSAKRLRDVNRTLSRLRDADAMLTILVTLRKRNPRIFRGPAFASFCRRLAGQKRDVMKKARRSRAFEHAARSLGDVRRAAKHWKPSHRQFSALAAGLKASQARGRKAMKRAARRGRAVDFHEWRKAIKTLWYELRLLESCGHSIRRDLTALHHAETWLGDDHDAVVLCEELSMHPERCGGVEQLNRIRVAADRYQCSLRKKTAESIARIYRPSATAYVRRIRRAWKLWQQ